MRVLFVSNLFPPKVVGGAEIMMHALAEGLAEQGVDVGVASLADGPAETLVESPRLKIWFLEAHPLGNLLLRPNRGTWQKAAWHLMAEFNPKLSPALPEVIRDFRPDLVHSSNLTGLGTGVWGLVKRLGLPIVHSLQDYGLLCIRGTMFRRERRCVRQCESCRFATQRRRRASAQVDAVVGISRFVLDRHLAAGYFTPSPVKQVILTSHMAGDVPPRPPRAPGTPLRIGYFGRLHRTKGIEVLLDACRALPTKSGWRLTIAGRGGDDYLAELRQRGEGLPIDWLPWTSPKDFFAGIDVLVVPSLWDEPLGMTIIEAGFWGLPVLVARRGGAPELIEEGVSGMTFDPDNPNELKGLLATLLSDPGRRDALIAGAQDKIGSGGRAAMATAYRDLYGRLLSESAEGATGRLDRAAAGL